MLHRAEGSSNGAERFHVYDSRSRSGITDYAADFHRFVLASAGYAHIELDDIAGMEFPPQTRFHFQLGVFQHRDRETMVALMHRGHTDIEATIHDPPFLTFPYFRFRSRMMMRLSRGFDWYLGSFGLQRRALERIARIFVLSEHGRTALLDLAPRARVVTIPHLVRSDRIWPAGTLLGEGLIYFGFIGPGKGLDHALEVHRALTAIRPGTHMHVIGQANGTDAERYLARLKDVYRQDVTFHGYVPDDALDALFEQAAHVILPYAAHRYIMPASGSAIHALRRGRILWTTNVNTMSEVIRDGNNGFLLEMDAQTDARRIAAVLDNPALSRRISDGARQSAIAMANYPYRHHFEA